MISFRRRAALCLGLAVVTAALFSPAVDHGFVYDDRTYVVQNALLQEGFTREGFVSSFLGAYASNWHPLTWLSHMTDLALFGLNPAPHHAVNVLLHAANAALLLALLLRWTGAIGPALLVSSLFALHPLRVESVAWVSERKDVLCGFFWMLALHAHLAHARRPGPRRYTWLALATALARHSKPMAVTLPLALLLVDYWPLRRVQSNPRAVLLEKIPLVALSLFAGLMTLSAQRGGGAVRSLAAYPLEGRIANALLSLGLYLKKTFLPFDLIVFYPYGHRGLTDPQVVLAAACVVAISGCAVALRRRAPWLAMGWCWYLVTVAPVLGLVQVGSQALADRYTYLPLIGVAIALVWAGRSWWLHAPRLRTALVAAAVAAILVFAASTRRQLGYWETPEILFRRAMAVAPGNWNAQLLLGLEFQAAGNAAAAELNYRGALAINPQSPEAHFNLGSLLFEAWRTEEAVPHLRAALSSGAFDGAARAYLEAALASVDRHPGAVPQPDRP